MYTPFACIKVNGLKAALGVCFEKKCARKLVEIGGVLECEILLCLPESLRKIRAIGGNCVNTTPQ